MNKLVRRTAAILLAAVFPVLIAAQPAQALSYTYLAGHPVIMAGSKCTGSYTISGASGSFIMTAGHCASAAGTPVWGTTSRFGSYAFEKDGWAGNGLGDSGLIRYDAGVAPYQIIVDPRTGKTPGNGRVTGTMPTSEQKVGTLVGKMGVTSGWTEGKITTAVDWKGVTALCGNYSSAGGDSGGPVWRNDSYGLRAVGMHVGRLNYANGTSVGCYIPIRTLLSQWGATMNVFPSQQSQSDAAGPTAVGGKVPAVVPLAPGSRLVEE